MLTRLQAPRCKGHSRHTGEKTPCKLPPFPFGELCRFHGGYTRSQQEKARRAMLDYAQWSTDPWYVKQIRLRQYQQAIERFEMRRARKTSPEHVEGLKREKEAARAERQREVEENRRAREEKRAEHRRGKSGQSVPSIARPAAQPVEDDDMERWSRW